MRGMRNSVRGKFLWHELMTTDPKSAEDFYTKVVGWTTQAWQQDPNYKMWKSGDRSTGGLMAQRVVGGVGPTPQWFCYIGTPDVDTTVKQATVFGGKIMRPAMDLPNIGRFAFLADPQGAPFAVFTPSGAGDQQGPGEPQLGDFSWHELLTTDAQAAWDFYAKLFAWEKTSAMDMGGGNMYQMFGLGGVPFGGMFTATNNPKRPYWLPYALVRDSKAAADTIARLGGTVINGPMEVPGGDWIVAGLDRQGASFAVHSKGAVAA
jgi:uncharacterized protein